MIWNNFSISKSTLPFTYYSGRKVLETNTNDMKLEIVNKKKDKGLWTAFGKFANTF